MNILNSARYNNNNSRVLNNDELRKLAPSIFAKAPANDRSDRYTFIPTNQVIDAMIKEGFYPVSAMESRARKEEKKGFTKHLIRFRQHDGFMQKGDILPEVVLMNSHDGTSSYQLSSGLFRLACTNGLIVADSEIETIRCRHSGNIVDDVIEGTYSIIEKTPLVAESVDSMKQIVLPEPAQNAFARAAASLRWDDEELPVDPKSLNRVKRSSDQSNDLFTSMNRIQENIIRGGVRGINKKGQLRKTRPVNSVGENVRLNKAIWQLAEEMKKIMS